MRPDSPAPAALHEASAQHWLLSGSWTARSLAAVEHVRFADANTDADAEPNNRLAPAPAPASASATLPCTVDASGIVALDSAGAWLLQQRVLHWQRGGAVLTLQGLRPEHQKLLNVVALRLAEITARTPPAAVATLGPIARLGKAVSGSVGGVFNEVCALLAFVGETCVALVGCMAHPSRFRWRPVWFNLRTAGVDALPIVGLLALLVGVVVSYQGADQLRQYGAHIFIADVVGLSMLREFAPLITAIIVAGRSGSAYAAQIGTMAVTEEIDAMRTLGIKPFEMLVLPKLLAMLIAMPLLTVFADVLGVFGGMLMARAQLGVGFGEFLDRFVKAVSATSYAVGIGKAPVFALIVVMVGCFQGFRTRGGADSVGRQTTRSVVQAIFLVIVADALFSVAFSVWDL